MSESGFCCLKKCSGEPKLYPVFLFWARGLPKIRGHESRAVCQMPICASCAKTLKFEDLISDEGWGEIECGFASNEKYLPDRATVELEFIPIGKFEEEISDGSECPDAIN